MSGKVRTVEPAACSDAERYTFMPNGQSVGIWPYLAR